jgi:two-component system, response regulator, stage 0 sporulation protein F
MVTIHAVLDWQSPLIQCYDIFRGPALRHWANGSKRLIMKTILVVDDEKHICELYKSELEDEGYAVEVAYTGKDALRAVETNPPDLIVLDIQMPGMDGIETLEKLIGRDKGIPVILNTAYSHYREDFTTWGADAYVVKSSDTTDLKREIKRLLGE